jgi:hypothetical protein
MKIASLFNLAGPDLFIILLIVLLLHGARNLPELARAVETKQPDLVLMVVVVLALAVFFLSLARRLSW